MLLWERALTVADGKRKPSVSGCDSVEMTFRRIGLGKTLILERQLVDEVCARNRFWSGCAVLCCAVLCCAVLCWEAHALLLALCTMKSHTKKALGSASGTRHEFAIKTTLQSRIFGSVFFKSPASDEGSVECAAWRLRLQPQTHGSNQVYIRQARPHPRSFALHSSGLL